MRKIIATLAALGLTLGLLGAGIGATFTDSATATTSVSVGSFGIAISGAGGSVIGKTITFTCPAIESSAAGSCPMTFTVTNIGTIPALLKVTSVVTGDGAQFSAINPAPADVTIAGGDHADYNGGLTWSELGASNLNQVVTVTYTISASA